MSHWQLGKLNLKCALSVLQHAILQVRPDWENYIKIDIEGKLEIFNTHTKEKQKGHHIVIPGGKNSTKTELPFADVGFRQKKDGTWEMEADLAYMPGCRDLKGKILREVAFLQQKSLAKNRGFEILQEKDENGKKTLILRVPVKEEYLI